MKRSLTTLLGILLLSISCQAFAQTPDSSGTETPPPAPAEQRPVVQNSPYTVPPFSRMSIGAGMSLLGIGMQVSTNVNEHLNLRATGNVFKHNTSFTISGVPTTADVNLASAGALVDYYPFHVGFRLSGGLLYINQNQVNATANIPGGDSFTLNHQTYYSANPNPATGATPLSGRGNLVLNAAKPGFLLTTGWGNHVRRSGHWTVPFEIGVAFIGTPKVNMTLGGWACTDPGLTICSDVTSPNNPIAIQFHNNLNAQIAKWNSDISPLRAYPILTTGIAYSFNLRRH